MNTQKLVAYFLRLALGIGFLSAVADRFGLWGAPGASGVAWGNFANFTAYTGTLNPFVPAGFLSALAWIATTLEVVLGIFLLIGFKLKPSAFVSGILLFIFAVSMILTVGLKAPLDYSVLSASAAAFALWVLAK